MRIRDLSLFRKFHVTLFIVVLLLFSLVLISFRAKQRKGIAALDAFILEVTSPVQTGATFIINSITGVFQRYIFLVGLERENALLRKTLGEVQAENHRMKEMSLANERFRKLFEFRDAMQASMIAAEVIGRDPSSWFRSITVNKGERQGVYRGAAVVLPEGIVGQVVKTAPDYAIVLLITDYNSAVDGIVQRTRAKAIVEGKEDNRCELKYLLRTEDVAVGDVFITSGLGGIFPKGLPVGEVRQVDKKNHGVFQYAELVPSVDLTKLEEVFIMCSAAPPPPRPESTEKKVKTSPGVAPKKK
jgi:rod shape-determining protein MreC